jgi:hypothetical protein
VPERIRLSRAKGWKMPDGAVSVARPTKWGNPFRLRTPDALMREPGVADPTADAEYEGRISGHGARHDYYAPGGKVTVCHVRYMTAAEAVDHYRRQLVGDPTPSMVHAGIRRAGLMGPWLPDGSGRRWWTVEDVRAELAGKDLACWCRPSQPCHADVLLSIAAGRDGT